MKHIIAFLFGILLFFIIAASLPRVSKDTKPLGSDIVQCPKGSKLGMLYFTDRMEFYYAPDPDALFAVAIFNDQVEITKLYILTKDGVVHEFNSVADVLKVYKDGLCGVVETYDAKKSGSLI